MGIIPKEHHLTEHQYRHEQEHRNGKKNANKRTTRPELQQTNMDRRNTTPRTPKQEKCDMKPKKEECRQQHRGINYRENTRKRKPTPEQYKKMRTAKEQIKKHNRMGNFPGRQSWRTWTTYSNKAPRIPRGRRRLLGQRRKTHPRKNQKCNQANQT